MIVQSIMQSFSKWHSVRPCIAFLMSLYFYVFSHKTGSLVVLHELSRFCIVTTHTLNHFLSWISWRLTWAGTLCGSGLSKITENHLSRADVIFLFVIQNEGSRQHRLSQVADQFAIYFMIVTVVALTSCSISTLKEETSLIMHFKNAIMLFADIYTCLGLTRLWSTKLCQAGLSEWSTWSRSYWTTMANAIGKFL